MTALIHPPGNLPEGAPRGLVDIWMSAAPTQMAQVQAVLHGVWQQHGGAIALAVGGMILVLAFGLWLARDWRGRVLRFSLHRLARLLARDARTVPEPIGAALMWSLARYFGMRPALDRRRLPEHWHDAVRQLDALRFAAAPQATRVDPMAERQAWQALLRRMATLSRQASQPFVRTGHTREVAQ